MRTRYTAIIGTVIAAAFLVLSVSVACGKVADERIAEDVAREWTMTEGERISEEIAAEATRRYGYPAHVRVVYDPSFSGRTTTVGERLSEAPIPTVANAEQIQASIQWEFGQATRRADGGYEVIATASISFYVAPSGPSDILQEMPSLIPLLKRPYGGSVDYSLVVDTTEREVRKANMPLASVRLRELPPGGNVN